MTRDRERCGPAPQRPRPTQSPATVRCFIALQPDEAALERLDRLAREQQARFPSARRLRRENLHLTLAFIGVAPRAQARQVAARLADLPFEPFDWTVDAVGAFGGTRVLWAGGSSDALRALAQRTRALLDDLAVPYDRRPFVAHVTLLRNVPRGAAHEVAAAVAPPIVWHAGPPVLLQSTTEAGGTRYTALPAGDG